MATQQSNGCLSVLYRVFIALLIIFLIGNLYTAARMELARLKVYRLAHQLDYTPATYLHSKLEYGVANLITGAAEGYVTLYYTTPMTATVYGERLAQIDSEVFHSGVLDTYYLTRELGIDLFAREDSNQDHPIDQSLVQPPFPDGWRMPNYDVNVDFQVLSKQEYRVEYQGQPITDNIVKLTASGGIMQPWFMFGVLLWEKAHIYGL